MDQKKNVYITARRFILNRNNSSIPAIFEAQTNVMVCTSKTRVGERADPGAELLATIIRTCHNYLARQYARVTIIWHN